MAKKNLFFILFVQMTILLILLLSFKPFTQKSSLLIPTPINSPDKIYLEKAKWKQYLLKVGAEKGYKDFITSYKNVKNYNVKHGSLHYIGEILYESEGAKGIKICDDSFFYACYHGFFGQFFQKKAYPI